MKKSDFLLLLFCLMTVHLSAQPDLDSEKKLFLYGNDSMPYRILLPKNFKPGKKYPLIIFLHGAGERGNDNEKQLVHGSALFLNENNYNKYPSIVIFPQCRKERYWSNMINEPNMVRSFNFKRTPTKEMKMLLRFIPFVLKAYPVKAKQVYVGGLSMGGMGVFEIVARKPGFFAAAFPICGGGDTTATKQLANTSWWIFHGEKDDVVWPYYSKQMANALIKAGAKVKLSLYPGANHNSWDKAFAEPQLLPWLFSQHK